VSSAGDLYLGPLTAVQPALESHSDADRRYFRRLISERLP